MNIHMNMWWKNGTCPLVDHIPVIESLLSLNLEILVGSSSSIHSNPLFKFKLWYPTLLVESMWTLLRSWLFPGSIPTLHITRNRTFRAAAFAPLFVLSRREPFEEPAGATSSGVDPGNIGGEIHQFSEKFQGMSIDKSPYSDSLIIDSPYW